MSATEREHVMPPRPLIPWTMALCAGMCVSCALVLSIAADALLRERATARQPRLREIEAALAGAAHQVARAVLDGGDPYEAFEACQAAVDAQ